MSDQVLIGYQCNYNSKIGHFQLWFNYIRDWRISTAGKPRGIFRIKHF